MTFGVMMFVTGWPVSSWSNGLDRAAVVDEALELDHLRNEVQIDGVAVRAR